MGGAAIHAHTMSKLQAEMGHDVTVLSTDRGDRSLSRTDQRAGYTIQRSGELFTLFGNSIAPTMLTMLRNKLSDYDIVHAHSHLSFMANISALVTRLDDTPFVITNHGIRSQTAPELVQDIYLPTLGMYTFNSADLVFTYSDVERDRLEKLGVSSDVSVIHNGVNCDKFAPRDINGGDSELLFVGRLRETKGPHLLVEIIDQLHSEFPELTLKIVGEGPMREELAKDISKRGLLERIDLVGEVPNESMSEFYNEASAFVLPTSREGVPRTILEAMACATPVVTTDLPQVEPVVRDGGLLIKRDAEAFATAICELLESPMQRAEMGKRAREQIRKNYSWEDTVRNTTQKYYEVLDNHV